ncbi:hypothetical protein BaRGS_00032518 [Batillaria attramentaria]|uniref:Uncharacterized protein n=1 Tax=Batillaria attramentaria TaxID=370345 RepID=A0ABD0JMR2_9CAEN
MRAAATQVTCSTSSSTTMVDTLEPTIEDVQRVEAERRVENVRKKEPKPKAEVVRRRESKGENTKTEEELERIQELRRQKQREKKRQQRARKRELARKMLEASENVNHTSYQTQRTGWISEENSMVGNVLKLGEMHW